MTIANRIQQYFEGEQFGIKDIEELIEEGLIPGAVASLGVDFLEFVESFYDNDGNYNEDGISSSGRELLRQHAHKYEPSYKLE